MSNVPPLRNGMPRVDWDETAPADSRLSAIITENTGIFLMAADTGLELVFEPIKNHDGRVVAGKIVAKRRAAPPMIVGLKP